MYMYTCAPVSVNMSVDICIDMYMPVNIYKRKRACDA